MQGVGSIGLILFLVLLNGIIGSILFIIFSYEGLLFCSAYACICGLITIFFGKQLYKHFIGVAPLVVNHPFEPITNGMSRHFIGPSLEICVSRRNPYTLSHFPAGRNNMVIIIGHQLLKSMGQKEIKEIYRNYFEYVYKPQHIFEAHIRLFYEVLYKSLSSLKIVFNLVKLGEVYQFYLKTFFKIGASLSFKEGRGYSGTEKMNKKTLYYCLSLIRRHTMGKNTLSNQMFLNALELNQIFSSYWEEKEASEEDEGVLRPYSS